MPSVGRWVPSIICNTHIDVHMGTISNVDLFVLRMIEYDSKQQMMMIKLLGNSLNLINLYTRVSHVSNCIVFHGSYCIDVYLSVCVRVLAVPCLAPCILNIVCYVCAYVRRVCFWSVL